MALQTLLSNIPQVEIVGHADNTREASELIDQRKPDVALLDIPLSGGTGIDVSKRIKKTLPARVVIIFTPMTPAISYEAPCGRSRLSPE